MKTRTRFNPANGVKFLIPFWTLATATLATASVSWNLKISPSGGGEIVWATNSPPASGVLTASSGKITFNEGALVDLTFRPKPGWRLVSVLKNGDQWLPFLDGSNHFRFGPVSSPHTIVASFVAEVPTGNFAMNFPPGATNLPAVIDVSGNYTGVTPTRFARPYDIDVAMDEEGKIDAMGTMQGYAVPGGSLPHVSGSVTTSSAGPVVEADGTFTGTRDGVSATGKGSAEAPATINALPGGSPGVNATVSYRANTGGVAFSDSNMPMDVPVSPQQATNLKRQWGIRVNLNERTAAGSSKSAIYASADLTMTNGDVVRFAERAVRFNGAAGYSITFKGGTNISASPNRLARKVSVALKSMTLTKSGGVWTISGGTMSYAFLGQRGSGSLTSFQLP